MLLSYPVFDRAAGSWHLFDMAANFNAARFFPGISAKAVGKKTKSR